uniref:AlNc14C47G3772 protein n=1 Tax=Albugo laibachii Nc14 TaxID=890382 RepID=F0WAQ7_9STRA|nr:AlNc14C47G3772 [Albugo laibachii Nc14]|eukprot:CCA18229.1 AlNc14C47G3772 [Albugo laibachii Nc14]
MFTQLLEFMKGIQTSQLETRNEELSNALEDKSGRLNNAVKTITDLNTKVEDLEVEGLQSSQLEKRNDELSRALKDKSARLNDTLETISELNAKVEDLEAERLQSIQLETRNEELSNALEDKSARLKTMHSKQSASSMQKLYTLRSNFSSSLPTLRNYRHCSIKSQI